MTIKDLLSRSFVISVDENRINTFNQRFQKYNLTPLPKVFRGAKFKDGVYGDLGFVSISKPVSAHLTHLSLIQMANVLNWDFICVFEDDAFPRVDIIQKLQYYLSILPSDTDMFKMGHMGLLTNPPKIIDDNFIMSDTVGAHAYVVFKKYYEPCIRFIEQSMHIDGIAMNTKDYKVLIPKDVLFMQNDSTFSSTLHNNSYFKNIFINQHHINGFDLNEK